jgi:hypothetical protein
MSKLGRNGRAFPHSSGAEPQQVFHGLANLDGLAWNLSQQVPGEWQVFDFRLGLTILRVASYVRRIATPL